MEIGELDLIEKGSFIYIFDYGNEWLFNIEVLIVKKEVIEEFQGEIIESKGELPQQYPDFDDEC